MFNDQRGLRHGKGLETGLSRKLENDIRTRRSRSAGGEVFYPRSAKKVFGVWNGPWFSYSWWQLTESSNFVCGSW
jgi:hypothetical protein